MTATTTRSPIRAFDVVVDGLERLSPSFVRVTFGGACLALLDAGGPLGPRDLRVKVMIPSPGRPLPDFSDLGGGWYQQWLAMDPDVRGSMRTYTVRRARPDGPRPQLEIDFVLHLDDRGRGGPASTWAASARPGDRLTVLGPDVRVGGGGGVEWCPPGGPSPLRVLLAGDETAVPAIGSVLETLPAGVRGHALLEVPSAHDWLDLSTASGVEVTWLARGATARGARLHAAVRAAVADVRPRDDGSAPVLPDVDVDGGILWETPERLDVQRRPVAQSPDESREQLYAWLAGEAAVVKELRRYLVRERGLDRRSLSFMGYWREGRSEG